MVTITNGQLTLTVPNSAYKSFYSISGFHPLDGEEHIVTSSDTFPAPSEETGTDVILDEENRKYDDDAETNLSDEEIDLSEIPIGEMDFYQLCDYADQLGLDRRGIRSKKELRALIRSAL